MYIYTYIEIMHAEEHKYNTQTNKSNTTDNDSIFKEQFIKFISITKSNLKKLL